MQCSNKAATGERRLHHSQGCQAVLSIRLPLIISKQKHVPSDKLLCVAIIAAEG